MSAAKLSDSERLLRPQRVGLVGFRGIGKTTLLTMLYREAVSGRLSGVRLAAGDAASAQYLGDKVAQLEAGSALPGTLSETEVRFHLYRQECRHELVVHDYQGEHIELGRLESIQEYLQDCDALWLCYSAQELADPVLRLRRQQECEQLLEAYLSQATGLHIARPVAVLITKGDTLPDGTSAESLLAQGLSMTQHTLQAHCPNRAGFVVSCLHKQADNEGTLVLSPTGLAEPLVWLSDALFAQDQARLAACFQDRKADIATLTKCLAKFQQRYPDSPVSIAYAAQLRTLRRQQFKSRLLAVSSLVASLVVGIWAYDAFGQQQATRYADQHADQPSVVREHWLSYARWHPTRHWLRASDSELAEQNRLACLAEEVQAKACNDRLAELRRRAALPDQDPELVWADLLQFRKEYPESALPDDLLRVRTLLEQKRQQAFERRALQAHEDLLMAEKKATTVPAQVALLDKYLHEFSQSGWAVEVRKRREKYLLRQEEEHIESARSYSAKNPTHFASRLEKYQQYQSRYATGRFVGEAKEAMLTIAKEWDKHDFRLVRDWYLAQPASTLELANRCRSYLAVHPKGTYVTSAKELLSWLEQMTTPTGYRVVVRRGEFDKSVAHFFSRGPKLSVELEVNGVRYGPSDVSLNQYQPEWNFEFARPVRWKLGDAVTVRVREHSWKTKVVAEVSSAEGDPFALRMLTEEVTLGKHRVWFEVAFPQPVLPSVE